MFCVNDPRSIHRTVRGRRRPSIAATLAATAVMMVAPLALAEGSWVSYISGASDGFTSRRFTDYHLDTVSTNSTLSGCSLDYPVTFALTVELRRDRTLLPDVSYGTRDFSSCNGRSVTAYWGEMMAAGSYFFQYFHYPFTRLSVSYVRAGY